jgi:hypothetical protein
MLDSAKESRSKFGGRKQSVLEIDVSGWRLSKNKSLRNSFPRGKVRFRRHDACAPFSPNLVSQAKEVKIYFAMGASAGQNGLLAVHGMTLLAGAFWHSAILVRL